MEELKFVEYCKFCGDMVEKPCKKFSEVLNCDNYDPEGDL